MHDAVDIRPLATEKEYAACVELQRETWGREFRETVPPSMMLVSQKLGGVAAGAFDRAGALIGFVFGITGVRNGEIVHWSDMLAVRPEAQNRGLGRALKEYQRAAVAAVGARAVLWTYDPLVARNAHLNFNVFGVAVEEYVPNMYGTGTGSDLHRGVGTDRLIVAWPVDDEALAIRKGETAAARESRDFGAAPTFGDPAQPDRSAEAHLSQLEYVRIAVPGDLTSLLADDPAQGAVWRQSNRAAFQRAFALGFNVAGFSVAKGSDRGYYLLSK